MSRHPDIKQCPTAAVTLLALALTLGVPARVHAQEQSPNPAPATQTVNIRVVEIAGGQAFIEPGEDAGLRAGQTVTVRGRRFRIAAVNRTSAVIELGNAGLREGDRGRATVEQRSMEAASREPPAPLTVFEEQWDEAIRPATQQNPKLVRLGSAGPQGRVRLILQGSSATIMPDATKARTLTRATLGAYLRAEPWQETPFGFDADVAVSQWFGGVDLDNDSGSNSRPILRVRELRLRYGDEYAPRVGLGRLRYAASTLGLLDGARVQASLAESWNLAAFGGVVPDPLNGEPAFDAARFGVEATYQAPKSSWRPLINVVAHGSMFDGELDERRLSSYLRLYRGPLAVMAHAEVSQFDDDNPWGAELIELTAAGVDATVRVGSVRAGARFDMRQPERSLWLASLLPQSWLCTAQETLARLEPCNGNRDIRYSGSIDAGIERGRLAVMAGATAVGVSTGEAVEEVTVFADMRALRILGPARVQLGAMGTNGRFLDTVAGRVGVGAAVVQAVDVSFYYRPALLRYAASVDDLYEHRFGTDILFMPQPALDVALTVEGTTGDDAGALGMYATAVWRPRLPF